MNEQLSAIAAQAELHHQLLLGLELMVATREGPQVVGDWMFHLFRQQHEDKFLASFAKLGLQGLPHAVACARYHVLSNGIGGVAVEYMEESHAKAWVRFRYPRWMFDGAAICGIPQEASRSFLRGWYAHNGVSLGNPRLGFVCVSEDVGEDLSGPYGLCGYFREAEHELAEDERLVFAPHERPPPFDPAHQPQPPEAEWSAERLAKARRNYALDYIRNGVAALVQVLGRERALALATHAARLTGLQQYRHMAAAVRGVDGGPNEAAAFLAAMFEGMGDHCRVETGVTARVHQQGLRVLRGLPPQARADLLACWTELWRGALHSHRAFMALSVEPSGDEGLVWTITPNREGTS